MKNNKNYVSEAFDYNSIIIIISQKFMLQMTNISGPEYSMYWVL